MEIELTVMIAVGLIMMCVFIFKICLLEDRLEELEEEVEDMDKSFDETIIDLKNDLSRVVVDKKNKYSEPCGNYSFMCNGHRIYIQQFVDIILDHLKIDIKKEGGLSIYKKK